MERCKQGSSGWLGLLAVVVGLQAMLFAAVSDGDLRTVNLVPEGVLSQSPTPLNDFSVSSSSGALFVAWPGRGGEHYSAQLTAVDQENLTPLFSSRLGSVDLDVLSPVVQAEGERVFVAWLERNRAERKAADLLTLGFTDVDSTGAIQAAARVDYGTELNPPSIVQFRGEAYVSGLTLMPGEESRRQRLWQWKTGGLAEVVLPAGGASSSAPGSFAEVEAGFYLGWVRDWHLMLAESGNGERWDEVGTLPTNANVELVRLAAGPEKELQLLWIEADDVNRRIMASRRRGAKGEWSAPRELVELRGGAVEMLALEANPRLDLVIEYRPLGTLCKEVLEVWEDSAGEPHSQKVESNGDICLPVQTAAVARKGTGLRVAWDERRTKGYRIWQNVRSDDSGGWLKAPVELVSSSDGRVSCPKLYTVDSREYVIYFYQKGVTTGVLQTKPAAGGLFLRELGVGESSGE